MNQLLVDIGSGKRTSNFVSQSFSEALRGKKKKMTQLAPEIKIGSPKKYGALKFPECCYPVSGDPSLAIHTETGITIHRNECNNLHGLLNKSGRYSNVVWEKSKSSEFLSALNITMKNEPGVLADITKLISENNTNIESVSSRHLDENFVEINLRALVYDLNHLNLIIESLDNHKMVTSVSRHGQ